MPVHNMEGEHIAPAEQVPQLPDGEGVLVIQGEEIKILRGLENQALVIGSPALHIVAGIGFGKGFRGGAAIRHPHALQGVAHGKNRAGGFLQIAAGGAVVPFAVPPAVLLAVEHLRPFLLRRSAGDGDQDFRRLCILLAVDAGHSQGVDAFQPGAEGGGKMVLCFLGLVFRLVGNGLFPVQEQLVDDLLRIRPGRGHGYVHIISHPGLLRRKGNRRVRQGGGTRREQQEKAQEKEQSFHQSETPLISQRAASWAGRTARRRSVFRRDFPVQSSWPRKKGRPASRAERETALFRSLRLKKAR